MRRLAMAICCLAVVAIHGTAAAQSNEAPPANTVDGIEQPDETPEPSESAEERYKKHFQDGKQKYINQDFVGAVLAFEKAYEIRKNPKLLYNIGRIYERMSKFEKAIEHYDRFVHSPDIEARLRQDAVARLKTLREIVDLDRNKASAQTAQTGAGAADAVAAKDAPPQYEPSYTAAWITIPSGIATTALIGGGFHLMANNELENADAPGMEMMRDQHLANADKYQLVSYVGYGLGAAVTALGVYFALDPPVEPVSQSKNSSEPASRITAGPTPNLDGFSVGFDMTF